MRYEPALRARLTELDRVGRSTYAAACGELLVPLHSCGSEGAEQARTRGEAAAAAYPGRRAGGSSS